MKLDIKHIEGDSAACEKFLELWSDEIENIFPDFSVHEITFAKVLLLTVNNEPSGIFVYQEKGEELHVDVDYLIEKYRYQDVGKSFFNNEADSFMKEGFTSIISVTDDKLHQEYLMSLGFQKSKQHQSRFELNLN